MEPRHSVSRVHNSGLMMIQELLHLVYPRVCVSCGTLLQQPEQSICTTCLRSFDAFHDAAASGDAVREVLRRHYPSAPLPAAATVLYRFHRDDGLQTALHAMKYRGVFQLCNLFGALLATKIAGDSSAEDIGAVVAVPLHKLKKISRTYNQSELIARVIGRQCRLAVESRLIGRTKYTVSQTGLSAKERRTNVIDAFSPAGKPVPAHVLLVDDVMTTGSTVAAAMDVLAQCGAQKISLAIVALATS